jgi:putative sigma-54 modulation protein
MHRGTKKVTKTEVRERFVSEEYPIHVIGRHIDITEAMKSYALDKLTAMIEKFNVRVIDALVVIDLQRGINMVDFILNVNNKKILASGREKEMYAAIDAAVGHLKSKLSRYHKELQALDRTKIEWSKHPGERAISPLDDVNDMIEEESLTTIEETFRPHPVSKREKCDIKLLNEAEAIWKMEMSTDHAMLFKAEEDQKVKMIYRLHDGTYGIMESQ